MISRISITSLILSTIFGFLAPLLTDNQQLVAQSITYFELEGSVQSKEDNGALIGVTLEVFEVSESMFELARENQNLESTNLSSSPLSPDSRIQATSTDANGRFVLEGIPAGTYLLVVRYVGFEELRLPIRIPEEVPNRLRLFLDPDVVEFWGSFVFGFSDKYDHGKSYQSIGNSGRSGCNRSGIDYEGSAPFLGIFFDSKWPKDVF